MTPAISDPKQAKVKRIQKGSAAEQLFRNQPTKSMGSIPSIGYYFDGCEYVFTDSRAKVRP